MKYRLLLILLLLPALLCDAQTKTIPPQLQGLYNCDFHAIIDKFYREHLPLDGAKVKYIPFGEGKLYGFMDKETKQWIIKPEFDQVFAVYPEGAIVAKGDRFGLIRYDDSFLIPPIFSNLYKEGDLYHGMFFSMDKDLPESYGSFNMNYYFDSKGKYLFEAKAHHQGNFANGDSMAWFRYADTIQVFGRSGKLLKKIHYDPKKYFMGTFNNSLVYREDNKEHIGYTWYDLKGNLIHKLPILSQEAQYVYHMNDTMYALVSEDGIFFVKPDRTEYPYGVSNGMIFPGQDNMFNSVLGENELIPVMDTGKHAGYLSQKGELKVPCKYAYAGPFINGMAAVADPVTHKVGFINKKGVMVVKPVFTELNLQPYVFLGGAFEFSDSLCAIALRPRMGGSGYNDHEYSYGYADMSGKTVLVMPDSIIGVGPFSEGLAPVVAKGGSLGFINKKGETVIPFKYSVAVEGAYPFPQIVVPRFIGGFAYLKAMKGYIDKKGYEYFSGERVPDHYNFSH